MTITTMQFTQELFKAMWPYLAMAVAFMLIPSQLLNMVKWIVLRGVFYASNAPAYIYHRARKITKLLHRTRHVHLFSRGQA